MKFAKMVFLLLFCVLQMISNANAQEIINDQNGFIYIDHGTRIVIDPVPRTMIRNNVVIKDINNDGTYETVIYYYVDTIIKQTSMVIIANGKVIFDSRNKLYNDIYRQDKSESSPFDEDLYGHRTKLVNGKIFLEINKTGKYDCFTRLIYETKSYRLVAKQEISKNQTCRLATIQDPDGYTNLRQGPSKNSLIIKRIKEGETFNVLSLKEWCYVLLKDDTTGYVHRSRIKILR